MNTNENYALGGAYLQAKKAGFNFCKEERSYNLCNEWIEKEIGKMQEKPSAHQSIIAIFAVIISIGLGYIEATNCSQGLASLGLSENVSFIIGWILCCLGLIAGEELAAGIKTQKRDEFSGKRILNGRAVGGAALCLFYLFGQYYISSSASANSQGTGFIVIYVMLISILEVLVGAIYLHRSIQVISVMVARLKAKVLAKRMNRHARQTEKMWQRYLFDISKATIEVTPSEETEQIRRARDFFNSGGFYNETNNPNI